MLTHLSDRFASCLFWEQVSKLALLRNLFSNQVEGKYVSQMVKIWGFLPVRNENVPHISTASLPRNVQNNTGKKFQVLLLEIF